MGDAIIGTTVAAHLFHSFPDQPEGVLTEYKIAVVRGESLAQAARRLNFGMHLILGRGEENSGGRDREGILTDAFEAVTGAIHLTHGYDTAAAFIVKALAPEIAAVSHNPLNAKNQLQEFTQANGLGTPIYETTACTDGGFSATVIIKGTPSGAGRGRTKRAAESEAAQMAYEALKKGLE